VAAIRRPSSACSGAGERDTLGGICLKWVIPTKALLRNCRNLSPHATRRRLWPLLRQSAVCFSKVIARSRTWLNASPRVLLFDAEK